MGGNVITSGVYVNVNVQLCLAWGSTGGRPWGPPGPTESEWAHLRFQ